MISDHAPVPKALKKKSKIYELSFGEKVVAGIVGLTAGIAAAGVALGVFKLVTGPVAFGAIGATVAASAVPFVVGAVCIVAGAIGLYVAYDSSVTHIRTAGQLNQVIKEQNRLKKEWEIRFKDHLFLYALEFIRLEESRLVSELSTHTSLNEATAKGDVISFDFQQLINKMKMAMQENPELLAKLLKAKGDLNSGDFDILRRNPLVSQEIDALHESYNQFAKDNAVRPAVAYRPAINAGIRGFVTTFGVLMGVSVSIIATVVGPLALASTITTPGVGIGVLVGCIAVAVVVSAVIAYYRHKNTLRGIEGEHRTAINAERERLDTGVSKRIEAQVKHRLASRPDVSSPPLLAPSNVSAVSPSPLLSAASSVSAATPALHSSSEASASSQKPLKRRHSTPDFFNKTAHTDANVDEHRENDTSSTPRPSPFPSTDPHKK